MRKKISLGFTLIELLVVISIIGVLTSLVAVNFQNARDRARDAKRKGDLRSMQASLRLYYNDFQSYPDATGGQIVGCGADKTSPGVCNWGSQWQLQGTVYMNRLPVDPLNSGDYVYTYTMTGVGEDYILTTVLENASDEAASEASAKCNYTPPPGKEATYVVCAD